MTPFHEINPISYQEFLDIIQKETGLQSFRGRASRRGYGNLPSVDNTHYREPTFLSFNIVEHPTKRLAEELEKIATILSSTPTDLLKRVEVRDWGFLPQRIAKMKLGWNIFIKTTENFFMKDEKISEMKITYLFRLGEEGASNPDDEQDWYNIGQNEYIGWEYQLSEIVWDEFSDEDDSLQISSFKYKSGLTLMSDGGEGIVDYYAHSDSPYILKRILGRSLFDRFLNWRGGIPMEVTE